MSARYALAIPFWSADEIEAAMRPALEHLAARRVLAYPTETVYGFGGGDRSRLGGCARRSSRARPQGKPFLLLIAGSDMLARLDLHLPSSRRTLAARHWPGPLTLVLPGGEKPRARAAARPGRRHRGAMDVAPRSRA